MLEMLEPVFLATLLYRLHVITNVFLGLDKHGFPPAIEITECHRRKS